MYPLIRSLSLSLSLSFSLFLSLSLFISPLLNSASDQAYAETSNKPATDFLKLQVAQVLKLASLPIPNAQVKAKIDAQLLQVVKPLINFSSMSKASLGKHWGARSPKERTLFLKLFQDLVFYSYMKKIRSAKSNHQLEYESEQTRQGGGATVELVAITSDQEIELSFALQRIGQAYITEDVVIDSVSLVQNYREQFNVIITKNGFDALIEKMQRQIAKVK